ncbi:MAG: OmpA family protein [Chromatiaceae bacterium]|nr:OmpA family protein [Chromatiaceae bacterium]
MSDSSDSSSDLAFWRLVAFFLLFALIGVYLLYEWYDDRLKAQLAERDGQVEQARHYVEAVNQRCAEAEAKRDALHAEMGELGERHARELAVCEGQVTQLAESRQRLEREHAELERLHAEALTSAASERERAAATASELESRHAAAQARIAELEGDLAGVREVIAQTAAEHRAHIETLERHLNERVRLATLTPMDAELLKIAREAGVLPEAETDAVEPGAEPAAEDVAALQTALDEARAALDAIESERASEREQARVELAALQERLDAADSRLAEVRASEAGERERLEVQQAESLSGQAEASEVAQLREQLAQREARIAELETELARERTALAALESELTEAGRALEQARAEAAEALAGLESALAEERARLEALEARKAELRAEHEAERGRLQAEIETLVAQAARASAPNDEREARLHTAEARIAELERTLAEQREASVKASQAVRQLYQRFAELGALSTESGMLLRLANSELRFPSGGATLPDVELPSLDRIAALLADYPALSLRIEGHSDSLGSADINKRLSAARAEAVREALIARGVASERLVAEGIGPARPLADNATAEGRARNRRVEVYVIEG